ncbi:MAG: amidoligase family protein [Pseudomonadota bacterium]
MTHKDNGSPRRIGIELEFAGLTVADTSALLDRQFDAAIELRSRHDVTADIPALGEAEIALDTRHAKHQPQDTALTAKVRDMAGDAASLVVPTEITAPPIEIAQAGLIDEMVDTLRAAGARGTRAAPTNAFAMQLNIEAASMEPAAILAILRSFLLLEDWLRDEIEVDRARRALGFEHAVPADFRRMVFDPAYAPTAASLIDDYLAANPTRNRALDLLPILAEIDGDRVRRALPEEKIKARPAYHYRLPDCRIDEAGWSPRQDWMRWLAVERLAADHTLLESAMREQRTLLEGPRTGFFLSQALAEASISLRRSL